jgi:ribonuclease-3
VSSTADWKVLEQQLDVRFRHRDLLVQALTHRSFATEHEGSGALGNERLEFLGDAVLELVVSEHLYHHYPTATEGELTQRKAQLVSRRTLARVGKELGLSEWIRLGRGAESTGERSRPSVLAAAIEALIAAVYLDRGLEAAREFVLRLLKTPLSEQANGPLRRDYKSELQEWAQAYWKKTPHYLTVNAEGPDHKKWFTIEVRVGSQVLGQGQGPSKKEAEQEAARIALEQLKQQR